MVPSELEKFIEENRGQFRRPYIPSEKVKEILKKSLLPYLPILGVNVPFYEMYLEAKKLQHKAIAHRYGGEHKGWRSLVIHGISSMHTQGAEQYGMDPNDESIYSFTDISSEAPVTTQFLKQTISYERFQRVRFMYLEPGGYILPHNDAEEYFLGPINIALNNPHGCDFVMEKVGRLPFSDGSIIKLALIHQHAVYNKSNETRIHMILHGSPRPDIWEKIIIRSYQEHIKNDFLYPQEMS